MYQAYGTLGQAYQALDRSTSAAGAFSKAAETLDWIRGSVLPEHWNSFMERPDIRPLLSKTAALGGRVRGAGN